MLLIVSANINQFAGNESSGEENVVSIFSLFKMFCANLSRAVKCDAEVRLSVEICAVTQGFSVTKCRQMRWGNSSPKCGLTFVGH